MTTQALGGKSQVQIYAQKAIGEPEPVFVVSGGQARVQGALFLPDSVVGALQTTGARITRNLTYSSGNYDSGWIDAVSVDVLADATTGFVDHSIRIGLVDITITATNPGGRLLARLLRNGSQVYPPIAFDGVPFFAWPTGVSLTGGYLFQTLDFSDTPPSPGTYTYKWQVKFLVTNGSGGADIVDLKDGLKLRVLYPKNQV